MRTNKPTWALLVLTGLISIAYGIALPGSLPDKGAVAAEKPLTALNVSGPEYADPHSYLVNPGGFVAARPEITTGAMNCDTQPNPISVLVNNTANTIDGEVVICPNDGEELAKIFLCGLNDIEPLQVSIPGATSINWQQLNEGSCPSQVEDCANKNSTCGWNNVGSGDTYQLTSAGEYRLEVDFDDGCFKRYYFKVYKNPYEPQHIATDIICGTTGNITVTNIPEDYEFRLLNADTGSILVPYGAQADPDFDISIAGNYTVEMRQEGVSGGCVFFLDNIAIAEQNVAVDITTTEAGCTGLGDLSVAITEGEAPFTFRISQGGTLVDMYGPTTDTSYTFANINPGTYDVTVNLENGCTYTEQATIIDSSDLELFSRVSQHITCKEGNILMESNGGKVPHTYAIWEYIDEGGVAQISYATTDDIPQSEFQTSQIFDIWDPGRYTFVVVDRFGCFDISNTVTIYFVPPVDYVLDSIVDVQCFGASDGAIIYDVINRNGYQLTFNLYEDYGTLDELDPADVLVASNSSGYFTGLPPGDYLVHLNFRKGSASCDFYEFYAIDGPATALEGDLALIQDYTCLQDGTVQVQNVSGGTAPYEYSIDGSNFTSGAGAETFTGLLPGTYTVTIRDDNGCVVETNPITISPANPPDDLTFANTNMSCAAMTSDVTVTVSNGTQPFVVEIIAPSSIPADAIAGDTATFSDLPSGTYTFRVTDDSGCEYTENHTIPSLIPVQVSGSLTSNVSCFGVTDGTALFNVSDFDTTYSYTLNGGAPVTGQSTGTITLDNLDAGNYTIVVTDETTGCTDTETVTVEGPVSPLDFSFDLTPPSCVSDGSVEISASGGWGSYQYEIEQPDNSVIGPQNSAVFLGLTQLGTYTITVRDAGGCEVTDTFDVVNTPEPVASIDPASILCYQSGAPATIILGSTGGTAPYFYNIDGGPFQSSNTFGGLLPGTYSFILMDANGCTDDVSVTIAEQLAGNAVLTKDFDCSISPDAVIDLALVGGAGPFTYELNFNGSGYTPFAGGFPYTATAAGTYQFRITDSQGCSAETNVVTTTPAVNPQAIATTTDPTCFGDANGIVEIDIDPNFGQAPFEVDFNGSGFSAQTVYTGLAAGSYPYIVRDINGCIFTDTAVLTDPPLLDANVTVTDVSCSGTPGGGNIPGQIDVTLTSPGTPTYSYTLYDNQNNIVATTGPNPIVNTSSTTASFGGLEFGDYYIRIIDYNGCEYYESPVRVRANPFLNLISNTSSDCINGGTVILSADGGSGDYTFNIYGIGTPPDAEYAGGPLEEIAEFYNLNPGQTYVFEATDNDTNCTSYQEVTIPAPSSLDVVPEPVVTNVTCFGATNGSIAFQLTGFDPGVSTLSYSILEALTNNPTGFTGSIDATLGDPTSVVTVTGLDPGDYILQFEEDQSPFCSNTYAFRILEPSPINLSLVDLNNANCNELAQATVRATGGSGSFVYAFVQDGVAPVPGDFTSNGYEELDPAVSTDWDAYAMDSSGCMAGPVDLTIATDPEPLISAVANNQCVATEGGFEIVVTLDGAGIGPHALSLDGGAFQTTSLANAGDTHPYSGVLSGAHTITVRDANGCVYTVNVYIETPLGISAQATAQPSCTGTDGEITLTAQGGSGNYAYDLLDGTNSSITGGVPQASNVFTGLDPDTYIAVVYDTTSGCTLQAAAQVVLEMASPVTFDPHTIVNASCAGESDGAVRVNLEPVTAGVNDNPPYTYNLYDNGGILLAGPQTNPWFTGLPAGTYEVEALSGRGCSLREPIVISEPPPVSLAASATEFSCTAGNTISESVITATPAGGTAPYFYSIDGVNYITDNTFKVADTGSEQNITVYVRDGNGCVATADVTIEPLNRFTANVSQVTAITCINPESILITVTDNGDTSNVYTFELLPVGNPNGTPTGNPAYNQATFDLSAPDNYVFRVTDITTGCWVDTEPFVVPPYDIMDIVAAPDTPVSCFGDADGSLTIDVTNYTGNYDYQVFDSTGAPAGVNGSGSTTTNPLVISGLGGGNYFVRITQTGTPFCSSDSNVVTIMSPPSPLTAVVQQIADVTCSDDLGEILVDPSGGYSPFDIVLTNTGTSQTWTANDVSAFVFTGLSAGSYTVAVTDDGDCVYNDALDLLPPVPVTADITAVPSMLACYGDSNGVVTAINVSGGSGSYQYQLNYYDDTGSTIEFTSGFQPSEEFTGLGAGIYSITVSDSWGCEVETAQVAITEPTEVVANLVQSATMTCTGDAGLVLTASGGTAPYEYSTDGVNYSPMSGGNTHTFSVSDGIYQYYVRDSFGCRADISNQVSIEPVPPLVLTIDDSAALVNCAGEMTGSIFASASGGLGSYMYELYGDSSLSDLLSGPQSNGDFNNLGTGSYWVLVTSQDCETVSGAIVIDEPAPLQVDRQESTDITCAGEDDGTITVEVSGGSGTILYAISPNLDKFDESNVFTDLEPGVYDVIAQDIYGCFLTFQFTIGEPTPLEVEATSTPEVCAGNSDGVIDIVINGGTAPYETAFNSNAPEAFGPAQSTFGGLAAGSYVIFVRDAQGCETNVIAEVDPGVNLNATVTPVYECVGNIPDNYIELTLDDPTMENQVLYALDSTDPADMQLDANFAGLSPGPHYLAISHANGCVRTIDFEIEGYEPLTLTLEQRNINEITALAEGGVAPYTFYFNDDDNGEDNTYYINASGVYTVRVVDQNGCEAIAQIEMEFIDIEIPNYFTPDGDGNNDFWLPDNMEGFPEIIIKIYDRYGRVVAELSYGVQGWDGTYDGRELPTGDYWYVVKLNGERDDREFVGHFTLYR
ncbi:T9SS type B sorting domain-containing protein [Robiginitalea sp. SC105]|uniref:T9SS type B sorting domain-containing protein n=1 Tax=Robiginitalea sp. SC105 TaxID=2762332 RepID=UPI00163B5C9E|nr:T9SS type B sorting domain-containing protein [Robiginitalea sp. SC105]MBC2838200.1 T9SS type B sorting domain-containing protein [Robiginitalea sp. SC105]